MAVGQSVDIHFAPSVVALDGEREVEIKKGQKAAIRLSADGPLVVDIEADNDICNGKENLCTGVWQRSVTIQYSGGWIQYR